MSSYRRCAWLINILLLLSGVRLFSLDREAFSITRYDLNVQLDPAQQRLGARGKITIRNDSPTLQKIAVLQVSSSLTWRSIKVGDKAVQYVSQTYTSDIDHTGSLSEAIVTLADGVQPKSSVDIEIAYEGIIALDATRLTRIGAPEASARSSDWDQISVRFTAVRGAGHVAWYPLATEAVNLSENYDLFEVLNRWSIREADSSMHIRVSLPIDSEEEEPEFLVNATACPVAHEEQQQFVADCSYRSLGSAIPTFMLANYEVIERHSGDVHFLSGHDAAAAAYADAADKVATLLGDWFGVPRSKAETADLPDSNDAQFESGPLLLLPLANADPKLAGLAAAHQFVHAAFFSPRPWINEGLAHFAQALFLEHQSGRQAALHYLGMHRPTVARVTKAANRSTSGSESGDSLVNTADEEIIRSKAMCVWWMLRDMIGDAALKKAVASYRPDDDKEPSYLPTLIQAQTQRDLEWFFDDWVYRDRGLPDMKVESAVTRKTLPDGFIVTIAVGNSGGAGAEVPITVKFEGGEVTKRLIVRGKSSAAIRVPVPNLPQEIVIDDGSVPQSGDKNNVFKIDAKDAAD